MHNLAAIALGGGSSNEAMQARWVTQGERGWPFARTCVLEDDATMYASQRCSLNAVVRSVKHRAAGCSFAAVASALCEGSMTAPTVTPARCCTVLQCSCPKPPKPTTPIESSAARNAARAVLIFTTHRVLRKWFTCAVGRVRRITTTDVSGATACRGENTEKWCKH